MEKPDVSQLVGMIAVIPDVGGWGIDCGIYLRPRTYYSGVNIEIRPGLPYQSGLQSEGRLNDITSGKYIKLERYSLE